MVRVWAARVGLVLLGLALVCAVLYLLPGTFVDVGPDLTAAEEAEALMNERRTLITLLVGAGAAIGLYYTHKRHELDRDANRTDRYTKAVEQLAHDSIHIRLGGVYALERTARDSPADGQVIADVLSAFVREETQPASSAPSAPSTGPARRTDVAAALEVLGRLPLAGYRASLAGANLTGANLVGANLTGANLSSANLTGANLMDADLAGASLADADLTGGNLSRVNLKNANLGSAVLTGAGLSNAKLGGATLTHANLTRANLTRANLTRAELEGAVLTSATVTDAILTSASLRNAIFTNANLAGANLTRANLTDATLGGANLSGADLTGADLTDVHLANVRLDDAILDDVVGLTPPGS